MNAAQINLDPEIREEITERQINMYQHSATATNKTESKFQHDGGHATINYYKAGENPHKRNIYPN